MTDLMKCPECKGEKVIHPPFHPGEIACSRCKRTGKVPKAMLQWIERGKEIKAERLARKVTLRDEARNTGVDVMVISERERGVVDNGPPRRKG